MLSTELIRAAASRLCELRRIDPQGGTTVIRNVMVDPAHPSLPTIYAVCRPNIALAIEEVEAFAQVSDSINYVVLSALSKERTHV